MTYVSTHISNKYSINLVVRRLLFHYKLHEKLYIYNIIKIVFIFHINLQIMFGFLLLHILFTQDCMTPAELALSRGCRDMAKLIIDEGI